MMRLLDAPLLSLTVIPNDEANRLLEIWGHRLGPCRRPFRTQSFSIEMDGAPIALAMSCSVVSSTVAGYRRQEVVELARECAAPGSEWANRVMVRLWREVCAPKWPDWDVHAAVSYSHNAHHAGSQYRTDGWERVSDDCGSPGGGTWSTQRDEDHVLTGKKTLWIWRYDRA